LTIMQHSSNGFVAHCCNPRLASKTSEAHSFGLPPGTSWADVGDSDVEADSNERLLVGQCAAPEATMDVKAERHQCQLVVQCFAPHESDVETKASSSSSRTSSCDRFGSDVSLDLPRAEHMEDCININSSQKICISRGQCPLDEFKRLVQRGDASQVHIRRGVVRLFSTMHMLPRQSERVCHHERCPLDQFLNEVQRGKVSRDAVVCLSGAMVTQLVVEDNSHIADTIVERFAYFADIRSFEQHVPWQRQKTAHKYTCILLQVAIILASSEAQRRAIQQLTGIDAIRFAQCSNANFALQCLIQQKQSSASDLSHIVEAMCPVVSWLATHCNACRVLQRIFEMCSWKELGNLPICLLRDVKFLLSKDMYKPYEVACDGYGGIHPYFLADAGSCKRVQYGTFGGLVLTALIENCPDSHVPVLNELQGGEARQKNGSYVWQALMAAIPCAAFSKLKRNLGTAGLLGLLKDRCGVEVLKTKANSWGGQLELAEVFRCSITCELLNQDYKKPFSEHLIKELVSTGLFDK